MKKWIIRIVIVGCILFVIAIVAAFLSLNSLVKAGVETIGPRIAQVPVKLESAKISPFSGSGELHGLFVGNPEGYKTPSAITVGDVKVVVQPRSLLSSVIVVDAINIQAPEVTFEGGLGGNNLSQILANLDRASASEPPADKPKEPAEGGKKLRVKDLVIGGGKVNASVSGMGGRTVTVPLPDIHLTNIGTDEDGVTPAELSKRIINEIVAGATKAVAGIGGEVGKQVESLGKEAGSQIEKTTKGLKGLFKKDN